MAGAAQADRAKHDASGGSSRYSHRLRNRQFAVIQAMAPSLRVDVTPINARPRRDRARHHGLRARPNGGLIVTASGRRFHRDSITRLAVQHKLPAVYPERIFVEVGGLVSYGPDLLDQFRRAADYVDRILKGEKPADLPVQAPTKYELVSISRPPRPSASTCHPRCSPAPTR